MFFSTIRERHVTTNTENKQTQSQTNNNNNGVRQRASQQCLRGGGGDGSSSLNSNTNNNGSGHNNNNNNNGALIGGGVGNGAVINIIGGAPVIIGSSSGARQVTSSRIFDALAHPAQAAAAAAAAGGQPPRGRKRKTASLVVLSVVCIAVVKYSGTLYDYDDYFGGNNNSNNDNNMDPRNRRARLRSRSPDLPAAMDTQLSSFGVLGMIRGTPQSKQQQPQKASSSSSSNGNEFSMIPKHIVLRDRIVHALKAAFVADAASMGTHWIYNIEDLEQILQSRERPEFRSPPAPKYYSAHEFPGHYGPGQSSPYGEQLLFVTDYVASMAQALKAARAVEDYDDDEHQASDPTSILEPMSQAMQEWATTFSGRPDTALKQFLDCRRRKRLEEDEDEQTSKSNHNGKGNGEEDDDDDDAADNTNNNSKRDEEEEDAESCGADDDEAHFFLKVIPMTCLFVGHVHRRHYVEEAIRVHQNNDKAVMYGLALSDMFERVLLMDDSSSTSSLSSSSGNNNNSLAIGEEDFIPAKSLREALDVTLLQLQKDDEGWFHFAVALTQHHQQRETLLDAWSEAKNAAEQQKSSRTVADISGRACGMPGALIVSLHALYRAAMAAESSSPPQQQEKLHSPILPGKEKKKKLRSSMTHVYKGYDYYVKALMGTIQKTATTPAPTRENTYLVSAVRENILAGGDTCSRAILMAAILGAAYGGPPVDWWEKMYPVLSAQVEEAAYTIADYASRRLQR